MSRMKNVYTEITEGIQSIDARQADQNALLSEVNRRLDTLLHLMSDMVKLESKIEGVEKVIETQLSRMEAAQVDSGMLVDRLIEMTLVNQGQGHEAAMHRSQSRLENTFSSPQAWQEDDVKEDVWPPPDCDVMDIVG